MAQLTIDLSGRRGLAPRFWGEVDRVAAVPRRRRIGADGQMAEGIWNPFRRYGYLAPATATLTAVTAASGAYGAQLRTSIYDRENDDFYFGEFGQQLWKGDTLDDTTLSLELDLGATGTPNIMDLEIYQINGTRKLFVVYEKSDYVEVGISNLPYNTATDDLTWLSVTATNPLLNQPLTGHAFLEVADNGFAYLFMDNQVHKIDGTTNGGTNGTISANVLVFPTYFRVVDAVDYRGLMFIAIHQYSFETKTLFEATTTHTMKLGVYLWDRLSSIVQTRDFIPIQGCKEIRKIYIAPNGNIRVFAINSENIGVILEYNGSTFQPIVETGILAVPRWRDSLTTIGQMTVWLGTVNNGANLDGVIFAHGKVTPQDEEALYKIGIIEDYIAPGAILFGGASTDGSVAGFKEHKTGLYLGYATAAAAISMATWDIHGTGSDGATSLGYSGNVWTLNYPLPAMSTVKYIDLYMQLTASSASTTIGNVVIYFDGVATPFATKTVTYADAVTGHKRIECNKPFVSSIQLNLNFSASIATGADEFAPFMAIVHYEPTDSRASSSTNS